MGYVGQRRLAGGDSLITESNIIHFGGGGSLMEFSMSQVGIHEVNKIDAGSYESSVLAGMVGDFESPRC